MTRVEVSVVTVVDARGFAEHDWPATSAALSFAKRQLKAPLQVWVSEGMVCAWTR